MQSHSPFVPTALLRPYLRSYLTRSTLTELERATGVTTRTIYDILYNRRQHVRFDTADKLLTGMDLALEWYENEALSRYYALAV